jgi:hypothetical protein
MTEGRVAAGKIESWAARLEPITGGSRDCQHAQQLRT